MARDVAIFIVNFNMPESTDKLYEHITEFVKWPHETIVIDNGSDLIEPSKYTTIRLPKNIQTTNGWITGVRAANLREEGNKRDWLAYWFLITSAEFVEDKDPLTPLAASLMKCNELVGIHPALTQDSTTAWDHMKARKSDGVRRTFMIDNIASLWRADWFEAQGGFDPALRYAWGLDLDLSYKAREQDRWLWIHEGVQVKKVTDIGYTMERMNMSAEDRVRLAGANMDQVLESKYGPDWNHKMRNKFVEEYMR